MRRSESERKEFCEARASEMAAAPTPAEAKLWEVLEPLGFERQVHLDGETKNGLKWDIIADFFHPVLDLVVEVDGSAHRTRKGRDRRRDTRLAGEGIRTIRFKNEYVKNHRLDVEITVKNAMRRADEQ